MSSDEHYLIFIWWLGSLGFFYRINYICGLAFYWHTGKHLHDHTILQRVEVWPIKLVLIRHFVLKCLYNARRLNSYVFVLGEVACFYVFLVNLWNCSDGVNFVFSILSFKVILCKKIQLQINNVQYKWSTWQPSNLHIAKHTKRYNSKEIRVLAFHSHTNVWK